MTDVVRTEDAGSGVLVATMDRAPANALGPPIIEGLESAVDEAGRGFRALVLTSAIPRFFVAGADIRYMTGIDAAGFAAYGERLRTLLDRIAGPDLVTIAAVEGVALGGGLELAMAATMRVSGADAAFGLPEARLGLIPGAGGTQRLPRLVGRGRAIDIMATARQVPAAEAHAIGLVDRLVDAGGARDAAVELATQLAAGSRPALAAVVRTVDAAFDRPPAEGMRYEAQQVDALFSGADAAEGLSAFVEKRPPTFG
ncbi:enoyl-CoA hydratase/isomerase family protein [Pseudonocardia endophytica]|uniref:Enoyl-CoA hydratase n=1 Tax=Pseudonocardia endophytica TaxID=401976 RepID=A0A4R1HUK3_PSEEN|nr:enoyl-CoA hydratase-related protein [Pseudonocardia endophytica]TCK21122.1 enoyl-CoA hydratase [Pseudonocardia endophytica]